MRVREDDNPRTVYHSSSRSRGGTEEGGGGGGKGVGSCSYEAVEMCSHPSIDDRQTK